MQLLILFETILVHLISIILKILVGPSVLLPADLLFKATETG